MSQLKAVYTIPELAQALGFSRYSMRRLLNSSGVQLTWSGRAIYVLLASLQKAMPQLVETLVQQGRAQSP